MIMGEPLRFDPTITLGTVIAIISIVATVVATAWRFSLRMQYYHQQNLWRFHLVNVELNELIVKSGGAPVDLFPPSDRDGK